MLTLSGPRQTRVKFCLYMDRFFGEKSSGIKVRVGQGELGGPTVDLPGDWDLGSRETLESTHFLVSRD